MSSTLRTLILHGAEMAGQMDRDGFITLLEQRFPEIVADIGECERGLLHLEMGALAIATQAAISRKDRERVKDHFAFVDELWRKGNPELRNAICVSWLERLSFDGRRGKALNAREMLSAALQQALAGLEEYLKQLHER